MGMFDYVRCNARLPVKKDAYARCHLNPFQSKSVRLWESAKFGYRAYDEGCVTITIGEDFRLYDPDMKPLIWSGSLVFYSHDRRYGDFIARCRDGVVKAITREPDHS